MARIHLFMCSFLVSLVLSSSTTTVHPSLSVSSVVKASSSTPTSVQSADQTETAVVLGSTRATVQPSPSASATVIDPNSIQATPSSSANVTHSTSVAPGASTTKKFQARMTLDETYKAGFSNSSSQEFETFANDFNRSVGRFLRSQLVGFERVEVKRLANGSVVVYFDIVVQKSSNATVDIIVRALSRGNGTALGYTILGQVSINATDQPSTSSTPSPTATVTETPSTSTTSEAPTSSTKATEIWDKAIDLATPLGTFIIVVVAVALILILLIALICVCCKYAKLKKKTRFPEHMMINDSGWTRSSDDLLMWERNLRASEVKPTNGVLSRPVNDKRT